MKALQMKYQMKQSSVIIIKSTSIVIPIIKSTSIVIPIIKSTSIVIPIISTMKPSITYYSFGRQGIERNLLKGIVSHFFN